LKQQLEQTPDQTQRKRPKTIHTKIVTKVQRLEKRIEWSKSDAPKINETLKQKKASLARIFVCLPMTLWGNGGLVLLFVAMQLHQTESIKKLCLVTYVASEFRSSQTSTCHYSNLVSANAKSKEPPCWSVWGVLRRDFNAAHVIADVFLAMQTTHFSDLPDWITVNAIRKSSLLSCCVCNLTSHDTHTGIW
jgi:hypothetical protein